MKPKGVEERDALKTGDPKSVWRQGGVWEEGGCRTCRVLSNSGDKFTKAWNSPVETGEIKQVKKGKFVHKFAL